MTKQERKRKRENVKTKQSQNVKKKLRKVQKQLQMELKSSGMIANIEEEVKRFQGVVKVIGNQRRFGFLSRKNSDQDVFFHNNSLVNCKHICLLRPGDPVEFGVGPDEKNPGKLDAKNVIVKVDISSRTMLPKDNRKSKRRKKQKENKRRAKEKKENEENIIWLSKIYGKILVKEEERECSRSRSDSGEQHICNSSTYSPPPPSGFSPEPTEGAPLDWLFPNPRRSLRFSSQYAKQESVSHVLFAAEEILPNPRRSPQSSSQYTKKENIPPVLFEPKENLPYFPGPRPNGWRDEVCDYGEDVHNYDEQNLPGPRPSGWLDDVSDQQIKSEYCENISDYRVQSEYDEDVYNYDKQNSSVWSL